MHPYAMTRSLYGIRLFRHRGTKQTSLNWMLLESWRRTIINGTQFTWIPDTQFTWRRTIINDNTQLTRTHSPQSQFYAGKSLLNAGWHLTNWGGGTTMNIFEKKNFSSKSTHLALSWTGAWKVTRLMMMINGDDIDDDENINQSFIAVKTSLEIYQ